MQISSASTTIKIHALPSGAVVHNYSPGTKPGNIRGISWSRDGNWLAATSHGGDIDVLSLREQDLRLIHSVRNVTNATCAAFQTTTNKNLAVGTGTGQVLLYSIKSGAVKKRFTRSSPRPPASGISHVEWVTRDGYVVAINTDGEALVYSNTSAILSGTHSLHEGGGEIVALRTNRLKRSLVVAGGTQGDVVVWDIFSNVRSFAIRAHQAHVTAVAFSTINSDLVLSAGGDRQFSFFDIAAGKRIASVTVDNSITSVDFSPDGKFIGMGYQKGVVAIYDSRSIREPVQTFNAHTSTVKHLLFRPIDGGDGDASVDSMMAHNMEEEKQISLAPVDKTKNDSFEIFVTDNPKRESNPVSEPVQDSFMAAMGLNLNNNTNISMANYTRRHSKGFNNNNPMPIMEETPQSKEKSQHQNTNTTVTYSTPKMVHSVIHEVDTPVESPIQQNEINTTGKPNDPTSITDPIANDVIKRELRGLTEEMKKAMRCEWSHNMERITEMYLNLQMSMVKESIKVENSFNTLRNELICDNNNGGLPSRTDSAVVMEENEMLRKRIALLEQELIELRNTQSNCTCSNTKQSQ